MDYFKKFQEFESDIMEIQIICPMNLRGDSSVYALNKMIQTYYNPSSFDDDKPELTMNLNKNQSYTFKIGDKIINKKNNYQMTTTKPFKKELGESKEQVAVFNGYLGTIIDIQGQKIIANFPLADTEYDVIIDGEHWNKEKGIALGYAISTHAMQGSGANYVIYVLDSSHFVMHNRQQLYTGITRTKKHCALLCDYNSLRRAIHIDEVSNKQTFMQDLLIEYSGK